MWETVFNVTNVWALVAWVILIALPRHPMLLSIIMYVGVALLCLIYTILLVLLMTGSITGGPAEGGGFSTLAGVQALLGSRGGATIGWIHYLAFDLFTGMWIARDADGKGFARWVQAPILLITLFAGPVGLLLWLILRERRARAAAKANKA